MEPQNQVETDIDKIPLTTLQSWSGQYRVLYEHKRRLHDVSIEQVVLGQVFTLVVALAAGFLLEDNKEALLLIGTTLVLYPALADMLSSNAAVLSSGVHHDIDNITSSKVVPILAAIGKTIAVTVLASVVLGILAGLIGVLFFETRFLQTLLLSTLSGSLAGLVGMPVMLAATFAVRHMYVNPDNVAAPLETAIFNSFTLVAIIIVTNFIL